MASLNPKPDTEAGPDSLTPTHQLPRQKITAIARLKSFGETFVYSRKSPPVVFPPPSWELDDDEALGARSSKSSPALAESNFEDQVEPHPEPLSFAQKLKGLIESLPIPGASAFTGVSASSERGEDVATSPVPPGMDKGLIQMLSSEDVMNGHRSTPEGENGTDRPGIWNILAGLRKGGKETDSHSTAKVEEEEDGLMMYAPLEPKSDSQLELASSETLLEYVDNPAPTAPEFGATKPSENSPTGKANEGTHVIEKHVWVPSTTDLSILTAWWGYRLYLPPPVMAKLDGKSLKATARAAMITTALKWLLDKIPLLLVPPQLRPALKLLKKLSPLVSYIGVFIAWSWDRVRTCDKGNGVVLTATWILPVALVPMSWDAGDIYRPLAAPTPEEMTKMQEAAEKAAEEERKKATQAADKGKQKEERKSFFRW